MSWVIKKPKEFLFTYPEKVLTSQQIKKLNILISRRIKGEPIAYLRNKKEFYGLDFYVDKRVLIPRPETELLVDEVLKMFRAPSSEFRAIADIGTGSGCIIITLAKNLSEIRHQKSDIRYYGVDISEAALAVAKKNAKKHKAKIKFYQGNLLEPLKDKNIDIIITNLPYGWKQWNNNTSAETSSLKFEPQNSLFTKEHGLYLYKRLFKQLAQKKQKPKLIFCEFDPRQRTDLQKIVKKYLPWAKVEIKKDLARLNRILIAKL